MKQIILVLASVLASTVVNASNTAESIAQRCGRQLPQDPKIYSSDFKWGYELFELVAKFKEMYQGSKRLDRRAFWDERTQKITLPYFADRGGDITVTVDFVNTVSRHIERAYELKVIDAVFFPDMGHSHLLIPEQLMSNKYTRYPVSDFSGMYRDLFKDSQLRILYHTAEQLKMLDDNKELIKKPEIQWRHHTRNIVGDNSVSSDLVYYQNPESNVNTVHAVDGYFWWGGGFNLSANKNGCFSYVKDGQTFYYDISMFDLESDPDNDEGWGY